jgi:hypothetical protein
MLGLPSANMHPIRLPDEIDRSYWLGQFSDLAGDNNAPGVHTVENEVHSGRLALAIYWAADCLDGVYPLQLSAAQLGLFDLERSALAYRHFWSMFVPTQ